MRKHVEAILTARQLAAYKKRVFPFRAYNTLHEPEVLRAVAATSQQKDRLQQIGAEFVHRLEHSSSNTSTGC